MSAYGKVLSGGKAMTKGLTKGINDKLDGFAKEHGRRQTIATAVNNAFKQRNLSDNTTNNSNNGKFKTPSVPSKV
jgi:hypothetical protein